MTAQESIEQARSALLIEREAQAALVARLTAELHTASQSLGQTDLALLSANRCLAVLAGEDLPVQVQRSTADLNAAVASRRACILAFMRTNAGPVRTVTITAHATASGCAGGASANSSVNADMVVLRKQGKVRSAGRGLWLITPEGMV